MKLIYASLGLAAIGVAGIQSVQGQSADPSRSWSVSASLRGFYDDNVNGASTGKVNSYGFEVNPSLSFALPLEQTSIAGSYSYGYKWFEKKINNTDEHDRQTHTLGAQLRHAFSERLLLSVQDSFVIGQEPDQLRVANSALGTFAPISGDNIRNYGSIVFNAQITRPFGIEAGYANALYDYADDSAFGLSSRLDRLEHSAHVDGRWIIRRDTVGIVGYQFSMVDYTANQIIDFMMAPPFVLYSSARNSRSHYGYVGLEHTFRPDLAGNIRGGVRYSDFYNSPNGATSISPYFQGSLRWIYAKESSLNVGVSYDQSATDQFTVSADSITYNADSTVAYVSLTHRILPNLFGRVDGNFQDSSFNGGSLNQKSQVYYAFGVNLEYRINRHVSANVGYSYDKVNSDSEVANGNFNRNRVYVGATIVY